MIREIDVLYVKKKFGTLLSKLYTDAKISINEISNKLVYSNFLDCFENNEIDLFINNSYENMIKNLFNKDIVFENDINAELYWSGVQYINIFLNCNIPLKQIILLCPLSVMTKYYRIYHELSEKELIEHFLKDDYKYSILKKVLKDHNYSARKIAFLSDISENTIKYYELSNDNLFKASFDNINKISNILNIDGSLFAKQSNFVPYSNNLLNDKKMYKEFSDYINGYYNTNEKIKYESGLFYLNKNNKKKYIEEKVLLRAIKYAISKYDEEILLF